MTFHHRLTALLSVAFLAVLGIGIATDASAYPYVHTPTVKVSNPTPAVGSVLGVVGANYAPNELVDLTLHTKVYFFKTVRANAAGGFTTTVRLPAGVFGQHTVLGVGHTGDRASDTITIHGQGTAGAGTGGNSGGGAGTAGAGTGGLSSTGVAVLSLGIVGIGLLIAGGFVLLSGRPRRVTA